MARLNIPDEPTSQTFTVGSTQSVFPIDFAIFAKSDLGVRVDEAPLDQSAFTFTGTVLDNGGYQGGTVTLNTAATAGQVVVISRFVAPVRASQFSPANTVPVGSIDQALNRLTATQQDLQRQFDGGFNPTLATGISFLPDGLNALSQAVQDKLRRISHVEDRTGGTAFAKLVNALGAHPTKGYGPLLANDFIDVTDDIFIPEGVHLKGPMSPGIRTSANYDGGRGVIRLAPGKTITLGYGATLEGFIIIHAGRAVPYANKAAALADLETWSDAGTAINIAGDDVRLENLLILGFNQAVRCNGFGRLVCEYVYGDCLNGIWISDAFDIPRVENCHFWPFLTAYVSDGTTEGLNVLFRDGIAYRLSGTGDWVKLTNSFAFGYGQGINSQGPDHITVLGCGFDNVNALGKTDTIGIYIGPGSRSIELIACQAAAQGTSYHIANTPDADAFPSPVVEMVACRSWGTHLCHIDHRNGYLNVRGGTYEQNGPNEFRFADTIQGASIDLDLPNNPEFVGSATALLKVRRSGSHIPDKTFNMVEAFPGVDITAETNAFKLIAQKLADDGKVLIVPEGSVVDVNATTPVNGVLRFTGGGTIRMIGVNGPVFQFTLAASVENIDLGNVHFVNQVGVGAPYTNSCCVRVVSTDPDVFFQHNNLDDISGQGFHSIVRIEVATRGTEFGQESNCAWNRFSRISARPGNNPAQYGVLMKAGSGTGNTFVDFTTALYDTTAVAAAVRVEGAGCVCGDIIFVGGHLGGSGAILSFGAGLAYRSNSSITASQPDAGLTKICHFDAPSEQFAGFDIEGLNIGGGVTATIWPYMSSSVIREIGVARWEAARYEKTSSVGAKSIDLYSLTYAPRVDGQPAGGTVEIHAGAEIAGAGYDSVYAKYMVTVTGSGIALKAIQAPIYHAGAPLLTLTANVSGYGLTLNLAYTTSAAGGDFDSNLIARGGTLKISKP